MMTFLVKRLMEDKMDGCSEFVSFVSHFFQINGLLLYIHDGCSEFVNFLCNFFWIENRLNRIIKTE
ncbi:unnamed protein product [Arabidopsis halleri]